MIDTLNGVSKEPFRSFRKPPVQYLSSRVSTSILITVEVQRNQDSTLTLYIPYSQSEPHPKPASLYGSYKPFPIVSPETFPLNPLLKLIMSSIYACIQGEEEPRPPTELGIVGATCVSLYVMGGGSAVFVGTATVSHLSLDDLTSLQRQLHCRYVPSSSGVYLIVIRATTITDEYR